ncbi:MAG: DNA translocase FtsK [Actinomycetia bacterium]|nr:DNA translocase FtsK [Actinomycetes bacterium]
MDKSRKKGKAGGGKGKANGKRKKDEEKEEAGRRLTPGRVKAIYGVFFLALALFTFLCVFAPSSAGIVGRGVRTALERALGLGRHVVPFVFLAGAVLALVKKPEMRTGLLVVGMVVISVSMLALLHISTEASVMFNSEELMSGGGLVGAVIAWPLVNLAGTIGAYIFTVGALLAGIVVAFEEQISAAWRSFREKRAGGVAQTAPEQTARAPKPTSKRGKGKPQDVKVYPSKPTPLREEESGGQLSMRVATPKAGKYKLPPVSILNKGYEKAFSKQSNEERKHAIEKTLHSMDVDAKVGKVSKGPTVSLFEVEVGTGEKVKRVTELERDIAYSLGSPDIRIYSPIPGRQAIGIEVPNNVRDTVLLGDIIPTLDPVETHNQLTMAVGKGMSGEPVVLDLAQLPHLLLAGSTGAGKSCCINSLICCLLFRNRPDEVKLIMIDPKFVEFTWYDKLPHLLCDVINEPEPAAKALLWAVNEMDRRYRLLQKQKVVHIDDYNIIAKKDGEMETLPKIVIVIDELGDLMIVARREVESSISRLTAKARAVGIHMVIATQRPSVDVITGVIKNNITARIAFQVASNADSRTILGTKGAEKLLGKGDMLLDPGNIPKPERVQGALIQQKEIEFLTGYIREQKAGDGESIDLDDVKVSTGQEFKDRDSLLDEAAEFVVFAGEASASMLQTHLRVGYARARRIIVEMSDLGIVGPHQGSKPRKVLLTPEEFQEWKSRRNG